MAFAKTPSLEIPITVAELLDFHYEHNSTCPIYVFAREEQEMTEISYLEFVRACHRLAHIVRPARVGPERAVVAIVALVDTLVYETIIAGVIKAGLIPILISPRNTPAAVVNLLQKSGAHRLLTTHSTLKDLIYGIKVELGYFLRTGTNINISFEEVPSLDELYPNLGAETAADPFQPYPVSPIPLLPQETAMYLHSSGSTGFPKAIPLSHNAMQVWGAFPSATDLRDHQVPVRVGAMALPPFHAFAFYAQFACALYSSLTVALYPPSVTESGMLPIIPTSDNVLVHLQRTKSNCLTVVPAMLQSWSRSDSDIDVLRSLEIIIFAGGPLPPATGDRLVSRGVFICSVYGGTEFGCVTTLKLTEDRNEWQWHRFSQDKVEISWLPQGDGTFECRFIAVDTHPLAVENMSNPRGYATSDLFVPHPTKEGLWKVVGRVDDVVVLSTGEKCVPAPMENSLMMSPLIQGVVMFGRQRDQPGVLVEPSPGNEVEIDDPKQISTYRNRIWPVIEEANQLVPSYSRVFKETILVSFPEKPLPRAAKGTILRKAAFQLYEKEIDGIYETIQSSANSSPVDPPTSWESPQFQQWLTHQVQDLCGAVLSPTADLFEHGMDSLSATILRLRISSVLRSAAKLPLRGSIDVFPPNMVYNHPSIQRLANYIIGLVHPEGSVATADVDDHIRLIEAMIERHSNGLELGTSIISDSAFVNNVGVKHSSSSPRVVVLLTGSTGNLGAQILSRLLRDCSVDLVYALNRPSTLGTMMDRHKRRFADKGLDCSALGTDKLILLEGGNGLPNLGLTDNVYDELKNNVTIVIHNAWRLDFNLSLSSFEVNVHGMRNLIDLARSSRFASTLRFLFTSTISSTQAWDAFEEGPYPEEVITDAKYAVGTGYGEGKYVAERILAKSGLNATFFRIGQISGGAPNGAWAMSDWFPMIVKSSLKLNMLPGANGVVSWIPMDSVADAIVDVGLSSDSSPAPLAVNLVHPYPIPWSEMIQDIQKNVIKVKQLEADALPVLPFRTWLEALQETVDTPGIETQLPAVKIFGFLQRMAQADERISLHESGHMEAVGLTPLVINNIQRINPRISTLSPLSNCDAEFWVRYWVAKGL
ncbi:acetyl-CoA synthetase-like protein [Lentinula aciculospora]|uniref:Acetyl-CoA synthetase-like protein n=1 Tax=Lentinula aciculospora TaxID=153920 RepID=A0A9W9DK92_9AGAR|nr:acetyl-CoA synthetase-like protein [Lentinula aciculospora]